MKKAISLLAALTIASSLGVATFAADDIPGTFTTQNTDPDIIYLPDTNTDDTNRATTPFISIVGQENEIVIGTRELFLVDNTNNVAGIYTKLDPDTEYTYRVYYNNSDAELRGADSAAILGTSAAPTAGTELTGQIINDGTIRLRTLKGSSNIQSARIKTIGRGDTARYELVLNTRASYGTKLNDVEYSLNVTGSKSPAGTFKESTHTFEVGYASISDEETDIGEGGYITISNDFPVITKEQFVAIAKSVNYKTVNFEGEDGGWVYVGRVSGMGDSNFYYTYDVIPELINKYPDQEYKFLSFKAGVTFPASGEMRIDVSDIYDDFGTMYAYLYRNGKLTRIDSTYDSGANEIVFRTNYLGSFVITDTEITDTSIITEPEKPEEPEEPEEPNEPGSGNPNTGASSMMNVAVTLGLVSLVAASAVSRKRK